jgi:hypothetical protein
MTISHTVDNRIIFISAAMGMNVTEELTWTPVFEKRIVCSIRNGFS